MNQKFYLVTGGNGFIGSAIVRRLVQEGHRVRVLDNDSRGKASRLSDLAGRFEFVSGDVRNEQDVLRSAEKVDSIIHLAFVNGTKYFYSDPDRVLDVGVKGIVNVIDACLKCDVQELVLASSSEVYQTPTQIPTDETAALVIPDPSNPRYSYGAGKIISEIMTLNYGRTKIGRVLIFRPHNVYGPDMGWEHVIPDFALRGLRLRELAKKGPVPFEIQGSGEETRSFVYIDDFVDGVLLLLEKGQHMGIYHIGTMEEVTIATVARMVAEELHLPIQLVPGPSPAGQALRRCPDIKRMTDLGYQPKYSLRSGLPLTLSWYEKNLPLSK